MPDRRQIRNALHGFNREHGFSLDMAPETGSVKMKVRLARDLPLPGPDRGRWPELYIACVRLLQPLLVDDGSLIALSIELKGDRLRHAGFVASSIRSWLIEVPFFMRQAWHDDPKSMSLTIVRATGLMAATDDDRHLQSLLTTLNHVADNNGTADAVFAECQKICAWWDNTTDPSMRAEAGKLGGSWGDSFESLVEVIKRLNDPGLTPTRS
jgi:hypothetical protein